MHRLKGLATLVFFSSCSHSQPELPLTEGPPAPMVSPSPEVEPSTNVAVSNSKAPHLELRLAKLWARVDELDQELLVYKERMRLLEKGLLLGLVPGELKALSKSGGRRAKIIAKAPATAAIDAVEDVPMPPEPAATPTATAAPSPVAAAVPKNEAEGASSAKLYPRQLAAAQALFGAANYGQAIVAFSELSKEFPDSLTGGTPQYWIGLAWFELKEAALAEQQLGIFLKSQPASAWAPRAKFYVARAQAQRGMRARALKNLRALVQEYPEHEIVEMAKLELKALQKEL